MFRLANGSLIWPVWQKYPDIFEPMVRFNILKPLGHAFVIDYIERNRPLRILEIGHGALSPTFTIMENQCECWGLDTIDPHKTVDPELLSKLRRDYPKITFCDGYLGTGVDVLPSDYFDLVYSVSVIEHVPQANLPDFYREMRRILRPGGVHLHSYDVYWRQDMTPMSSAVTDAGFIWLDPSQSTVRWDNSVEHVPFEHPYVVLKWFLHSAPLEGRALYNWTSVHMGAAKPSDVTSP